MLERGEREPTMDEIVVALRETRRAQARAPQLALVSGRPTATHDGSPALSDIAELRDSEIRRLLAENAHLNERVVSLLKVIEGDQARIAAAENAAGHTAHEATFREVRAALEVELRPILLVLLRALQKRRAAPGAAIAASVGPDRAADDAGWIVDLDAQPDNLMPDQETRP
jgi:hypothetical protein